jgi:predicted DNA-binding transcriptional regulator AlpA
MRAPATLPGWPALLSEPEAAAYCGMSIDSFRLCVARGRFPKAVDLPIRRKLWQRAAIDASIEQGAKPADDARVRELSWKQRQQDRAPDFGRRNGQNL